MSARLSSLAAAVLALLAASTQPAAAQSNNPALWGRANYLDVCNKGTIPVSSAVAISKTNILTFNTEHQAVGWMAIQPGQCRNAFEAYAFGMLGEGEDFYIGFAGFDNQGQMLELVRPPTPDKNFRPTNQRFCVKEDKFLRKGSLSDLSPPCPSGWAPMQFSLVIRGRHRTSLKLTYTIRPTEADLDGRRSRVLDIGAAAPSKRKADAGIATAIGALVADLAASLPDNVDRLKGADSVVDGLCWGGPCRRSTLRLPPTGAFGATAWVDDQPDWNWRNDRVRYRGHTIKLTTRDDIGVRFETFRNALSLNLGGFQADPASTKEWFKCVDNRRMDRVQMLSDDPEPAVGSRYEYKPGFIAVRVARIEFLDPAAAKNNPCRGAAASRPTAGAGSNAGAAPSGRAAHSDLEIALAIADLVADLVRRLPKGFSDLKGERETSIGSCSAPGTQCWKSKLTLPATGAYQVAAHVADVTTGKAAGFKQSVTVRAHSIELAASAPIGANVRSTFANAVALKLAGFQAERSNSWCRPVDDRRTDMVEVSGADRKLEIAVMRMELTEAQSDACFRAKAY